MINEQVGDRGPTRPRGTVEREYLAALADVVPLETWREICQATVERAKAGDPKARDWLARYLIGEKPPKLLDLAADELTGHTAEAEIRQEGKSRENRRLILSSLSI